MKRWIALVIVLVLMLASSGCWHLAHHGHGHGGHSSGDYGHHGNYNGHYDGRR